MSPDRPSIDERLAAYDAANRSSAVARPVQHHKSSATARTAPAIEWWHTVLVLLCMCALGYGAFSGWRAFRISQLTSKLRNIDATARISAAEEMGRIGSPRAVDPLIVALDDTDSGVQAAAAVALGQIKDPRAVEPLLNTLRASAKDHPNVAESAAEALGNYGPSTLQPLLALMGDKDLTGYAIGGLTKMGTPAVDSLIAAMKYQDHDVQWQAANALGDIKDPRAVPPLIDALQVKELQWNAARSLGEIKDTRAVEPLIAVIKSTDAEFREQVVESLGQLKDPRADAPLTAALKDPEEKIQLAAASALGQIGDPQAVNILLTAFHQHNAEVIAGAGAFFIQRGEPGSEDVLIEALNNSGDKGLAEIMLNCGNQKLHDAANQWASSHDYQITYMPGGKTASWGAKP